MAQVDLFEDIVHAVAMGVSEKSFKKKIALIKKRYKKLSYLRIHRIIDDMINDKCWNYNYVSEVTGLYMLPYNKMVGRKHWELSQFIEETDAISREEQVWNIKVLAEI